MRIQGGKNKYDCRHCLKEYPLCLRKSPDGIKIKSAPAILKTNSQIWEYVKSSVTKEPEVYAGGEYSFCVDSGICPIPFIDAEVGEAVQMVNVCKMHNSFPYSGNYIDQPLWYIRVLAIIGDIERKLADAIRSEYET